MKEFTRYFLDCSEDKKDSYSSPYADTVSLREYYNSMKKMDNKFKHLIGEEVDLMNLDWLEMVGFDGLQDEETGEFFLTEIFLKAKDGINLNISYNNETNKYEDGLYNKIPKRHRFSFINRVRIKRQEEILQPLVQERLREIESTGKYVYDGCVNPKKSFEGFSVQYVPNMGMIISSNYEPIVAYYNKPTNGKVEEILDEKYKAGLIDKIRMYEKDMPDVNKSIYTLVSIFPSKEAQEMDDKTLKKERKEKKDD